MDVLSSEAASFVLCWIGLGGLAVLFRRFPHMPGKLAYVLLAAVLLLLLTTILAVWSATDGNYLIAFLYVPVAVGALAALLDTPLNT